jgi:hypothetical protein
MLLKPIAKALIRHKLAKLTKLCIEWLTINGDMMNHQITDWMIAWLTVWHFRLTRQRSAAAGENASEKHGQCFRNLTRGSTLASRRLHRLVRSEVLLRHERAHGVNGLAGRLRCAALRPIIS